MKLLHSDSTRSSQRLHHQGARRAALTATATAHRPSRRPTARNDTMPNLVAIDVSVTDSRISLVFSHRAVAAAYAAYLRAQDLCPAPYQTVPGYQRAPQLHTTRKEVSLSLPDFITWYACIPSHTHTHTHQPDWIHHAHSLNKKNKVHHLPPPRRRGQRDLHLHGRRRGACPALGRLHGAV